MSRRTAAWVAWSVCALSLALTALNFLLIALNVSFNTPAYVFWPELTSLAVGYSVIGAIIASRLPNHPIGWICCAIGLVAAVDHFAGEYAVYALLAQLHPLVGGKAMLWLQGWFWMLFVGLIVFLLVLFSHRSAAQQAMAAFRVGECGRDFGRGNMVVGHLSRCRLQRASLPGSTVRTPSRGGRGRLRDRGAAQREGVERQQIKWLLYAGPLFFVAAGLHIGFYYFWLEERSWGLWARYMLVVIGGLSGPIAIGIAILRYRLYEIDLLINRTLVYGPLTAMLALVYLGGAVTTQAIFRTLTGQEQQPQLAVVISTLVIAALFNPLRRRVQTAASTGENRTRGRRSKPSPPDCGTRQTWTA